MSVSKKYALYSAIDKVIFDYNLIQDGDKILVGASGGKDSTTVVELVYKMLLTLPKAERNKNVYIVSSDTLIVML